MWCGATYWGLFNILGDLDLAVMVVIAVGLGVLTFLVPWLLADELGLDPGPALREMQRRILVADIRELIRRTAGLPQALEAAGSRIASRPGWSIAEANQRLTRPGPDSPVLPPECRATERPYVSAVERLSPPQARAFQLLSLAEGPEVSLAAASVVLDLPPGDASALLESLVNMHLLESRGLDTYYYHEPLRAFARSRAFAEDGQAAR
ncbi:hypothetical protein GCM10020216_043780 [Nonomuraea helvata]